MCILLVEDEPLILMDVAEALADAGHEVLPVTDGTQALNAIDREAGRFSALVTDHRMPGGIYGRELAAAMRAAYPEIPIIIATGSPTEIPDEFRLRFRVTVMAKPYIPSQLVRALPAPRRPA